ncbi:MAG: hypothetical protein ACE5D7_02500 [Fidelibacterota bacterium]
MIKYSLIFLFLGINTVFAQFEFSFTGLQTSFQKKKLNEIPIESDGYELTWNFINKNIYSGELGVGAGNAKILSTDSRWSDLSSKGLFFAHLKYTRYIGFVYLSSGLHFKKITGDAESSIPPETSISGFDVFIQHNTYYFYEIPVSVGIALSSERFAIKTGILQSYYYGKQNYTQNLYQGLGNVVVNSNQRTFSDRDKDNFWETEFTVNVGEKYQVKVYLSVPVYKNDITGGFSNSDQRTIRIFIGSLFN